MKTLTFQCPHCASKFPVVFADAGEFVGNGAPAPTPARRERKRRHSPFTLGERRAIHNDWLAARNLGVTLADFARMQSSQRGCSESIIYHYAQLEDQLALGVEK